MSIQSNDLTMYEWDITDRLRKALKIGGVSAQQMAAELDCHRQTVAGYLNGKHKPPTAVLKVWALKCGVRYPWLATGEVPDYGPDTGGGVVIDPFGWLTRNAA